MPALLLWAYRALFLLLPWSVDLGFGRWHLLTPAEPLLVFTGLGVALVLWQRRETAFAPPLALWVSLTWVGWQAVSAAFSSMPVVSWKYWLVEAGHWWVFFVGLLVWPGERNVLLRLLLGSLAGVVLYTIGHHAYYHFRAVQANLAPQPFFPDHTMYSAVVVMGIFAAIGQIVETAPARSAGARRLLYMLLLFGLSSVALLLAGSRAAWLSLLLSGLLGVALYWRLSWRWMAVAGLMAAGGGVFLRDAVQARLPADVSSRERLNRYACARRMVADRPWTGFGPGTFQFRYLPYQKTAEMTRISLTEPLQDRGPHNYGRGGGAHSEYLGAMAEMGWPGLLLWLLLAGTALATGISRYRATRHTGYLLATLALLSFFVHGLVNNFLHDARVAALVWVLMASLTPDAGCGTRQNGV